LRSEEPSRGEKILGEVKATNDLPARCESRTGENGVHASAKLSGDVVKAERVVS